MIIIKDILYFLDTIGIDYRFEGDINTKVNGFSSLKNYKDNTMTWIKNEKSLEYLKDNVLLAVIQEGIDFPAKNKIYTKDSKKTFFNTVDKFYYNENRKDFIGENTYISKEVVIGKNVYIGNNCVIDGKIKIADNVIIFHNVVIMNEVYIGKNSQIHSGTVIGHDGFGWIEEEDNKKNMLKHYGGVFIGDNVLIGPNCVIDRGTIDDTVISNGSKIDGLCFIAHNVEVGENSILITGTKLYGSSIIKENVQIASAIVRNQCTVEKNVIIGMGSVVTKNIDSDCIVAGNPAKKIKLCSINE